MAPHSLSGNPSSPGLTAATCFHFLTYPKSMVAQNCLTKRKSHNTFCKKWPVCVSPGTCPDGWRWFSCHCYFLSATPSTFAASRQTCLMKGANLVIVDSEGEMVRLWVCDINVQSDVCVWMWNDGMISPPRCFWTISVLIWSFGLV